MKKNYRNKFVLMLLCFFVASGMEAAMSGVYTINSGLGTSGTNFQSFNDLKTALSTQGVSGPVTVNVVASSGPYYEQVLFTPVTGASSANRITINGNGNLLSFSSSNSNQPYVMGFNGADYFTINDLNMEGTGTYAWVALFYNNADYNVMSACTMSADINATYTEQIPILVNGNGTNISYSNGPSGNNNLFKGCTTYGGYYGVMIFGDYNLPYVRGNQVVDCNVTDFYYQGIAVEAYCEDIVIKNNIVECPNITNNDWARMGIFTYGTKNTIIEGNWVRNLFGGNIYSSDYCYPIYAGGNLESYYEGMNYPSTKPNYCRNNIVSDIQMDGSIYGIYIEGFDGYTYNNTVSLDDAASNGYGETYGIYSYGEPGYYISHVKNNIVSVTRGGYGDMFAYFNGSGQASSTDLPVERNDFYVNSAGGTNYIGYYTGYATTLSNLQTQGANVVGWDVDPLYTSLGSDYKPTNTTINNQASPMGLPLDQQKMPRSGTTPDIGALEFLSVPCSGTPTPGSVVTPTYVICPGESVDLILSNFSSDLGITYQWQWSTQSALGTYFPISGANSVLYTAPNVTVNTWFQVVVTCTNSSQMVSPVGHVTVATTFTSTVPYYESFEGIGKANRLPNCSWYTTDLGGSVTTYTAAAQNNKVPRTGSSFASYYYSPPGTRAMYTNGIWMDAGVTYSASVWYTTEYYGYNNWTDLSILVGPSQSTTGAQVVASTNGAAVSVIYKPVSGTFQVATSGLYYVGVKAIVNNSSYAYNLSWDDLRIEIPCSLNSPSLTVTSNQSTVCANSPVAAQAAGADTYSWSTGDQTDQISTTPVVPGYVTYYVTGTNTLSGCEVTLPLNITVNPIPDLFAYATPNAVCPGEKTFLQAVGANSYIWSTSQAGAVVSVSPPTTSTYAVIGINQYNCQATAVVEVTVRPLPAVTAVFDDKICVGDQVPVTGSGAVQYELVSGSSYNSTNPSYVSPNTTTQYTLTGTDVFGCENFTVFTMVVEGCVGLHEQSADAVRIFPNPNNGSFVIDLGAEGAERIELSDVTGRLVLVQDKPSSQMLINIPELSKGVYYIKVIRGQYQEVKKIITE